jgi:hypothetical protein
MHRFCVELDCDRLRAWVDSKQERRLERRVDG